MPIEVHCDCGKVYDVGPDMSGKKLRCKACGVVLKIPLVPLEESAEAPGSGPPTKGIEAAEKASFEVVSGDAANQPSEESQTCPACGSPARAGDAVCLACGAELAAGGIGLVNKVPRKVLVGGGAAVIVLLVALIWWKIYYATRDSHFTGLGREKLNRSDARGARADFEMALKYNPQYREALEGLLEVGTQTRDWRLIDQYAGAAAKVAPTSSARAQVRVQHARALLELHQPSRARDQARAALEDDAGVSGAEELVGLGALELGEKEVAEEKLRAASEHGTKEPRVYVGLARLAAEKKDLTAAVVWIHKAANLSENDASVWLEVAKLHEEQGDHGPARAALEKAAALDTKSSEIQLTLAKSYLADKQWDQAKTAALAAIKLAPDASPPAVALGEALLELGDGTGAKTELERALKGGKAAGADDDTLSRAELLLGRALVKLGDKDGGLERLEKALAKRSKDLNAHLAVGELALAIKPETASRILETALRIEPKSYEAHVLYAQALVRTEAGRQRFAQKIADTLKEAVALDPKRLEAHLELGTHYDQLGDYKSAIEAFGAGVKQFPSEKELLYRLGRTAMLGRNWDRAIEAFEKVGEYKDAKDWLLKARDKKAFGE